MPAVDLASENALVGAALALGAERVPGWSPEETALVQRLTPFKPTRALLRELRDAIAEGDDPLGAAFTALRSPEVRRPLGATYTPSRIVSAMVEWAATEEKPVRIVDPGAGSCRFAIAAARRFPRTPVVAVEVDPLAAVIGRANLAAARLDRRAVVELADYRRLRLGAVEGPTLYIGNPPYVRHHQIEPRWKEWLTETARSHDLTASQLAGLHVYFFLATVAHAEPSDFGAFITSAEWLDVNYGSLVRELILDGIGGLAIHVLEPTVQAFEDAATTAAITCFRIGARPSSIRLRRVKAVEQLGTLTEGQPVRRERLAEARRWTPLTRAHRKMPEGYIELGELCRVHRGAVTGSNKTWVVDSDFEHLPEQVLFPSITRARELFAASTVLDDIAHLRCVVDLPPDLDAFDGDERKMIDRFLRLAKRQGAARGYIARHRKTWWSVGLRAPAPILATYMARRPPVFVHNPGEARHINIAHGLYPRERLTMKALDRLAASLRETVTTAQGRTYAGGLTKFEPKEMERLPVPNLELLTS
jgi:adenine-specific DNA-methyltransferase